MTVDCDSVPTLADPDLRQPRRPGHVAADQFDRWIPVGEHRPPREGPPARFSVRVLVRVHKPGSGPTVAIDRYCDSRWGWSVHGKRVTHWRPLPSADLGL